MSKLPVRLSCALALAVLGACSLTGPQRRVTVVDEAWISDSTMESIDSVAAWQTPEGKLLVLATAKDSDTVRVYDAHDGRFLRAIGRSGSGPGEFARPNGIFVVDDRAFVVEHDNHRVQVLDLASNQPIGSFGEDSLRAPYGAWVQSMPGDHYRVHVTDSYYTAQGEVPPDAELGERVKVFEVKIVGTALDARRVDSFGATGGEGALRTVESIWGDPAHDRLLIADENADRRDIKVYHLDGRYAGTILGQGVFRNEPEGIALIECGSDGDGYWLVSDQDPAEQRFHLFDRRSLAHVHSLAPAHAHTVDGLWFHAGGGASFPAGVLFSQHADSAVVAFDWASIGSTPGLRSDCAR